MTFTERRSTLFRAVLASAAAVLLAGRASASSSLAVNVRDAANNPIPGSLVVAMHFVNGNPDPVDTRLCRADAAGLCSFGLTAGTSFLVAGDTYQVVATTQGYIPALVDQFGAGPFVVVAAPPSGSPPTTTINLHPGANLGEIDAAYSGATASGLLFGQVSLQSSGGGAIAYGVQLDGGAGSGTLQFFNVPYRSPGAPGNTFTVSAFDPTGNANVSAVEGSVMNSATPLTDVSLNFAGAPPPVANIGAAQQSGSGSNLSVYGVVTDTASPASPIPFVWLNFQAQYKDQYGQVQYDWRGANTDQNGVFQLYGLLPGVTYYTNIYGGCNQAGCFQGIQSTASSVGVGVAAPGPDDILYASSGAVIFPHLTLQRMPPGAGVMGVTVRDQVGTPFPQAWVGVFPDGKGWQTSGIPSCTGPFFNNPGFANLNVNAATGYALLSGLPPGNYQVSVWTPYGQTNFNAGADNQFSSMTCMGADLDDLRVSIDTTVGGSGDVYLYDIYGRLVSSGTNMLDVTVQVATGVTSGVVQGTITFPGASNDLSQSPLSIVLYPKCDNGGPCSGGAFKGFTSATTPRTVFYQIPVSSGQAYWMNVISSYWGPVFPGGNQPQPDLTVSSVAVVNMSIFPAGRVLGYLRKPDGSIYVPPTGNGGTPNVNANGNNSWGNAQIAADGSFTIGGLQAGNYTLQVNQGGVSNFPFTTRQPATQVSVTANQDVQQDLYMADAVTVQPVVNLANFPPLPIVTACANTGGDCPPEDWKVYAVPAGTPFTGATAASLLVHGGGGDTPGTFDFWPSTGQSNRCNGQSLAAPGFCREAMPVAKKGAAFDFYMMRAGGFDSGDPSLAPGGWAGGARPYFVIETSTRGIIVGGPSATLASVFDPGNHSTTTVQHVPLDPPSSLAGVPQARLAGTVTAANMINQREFQLLAGNFDKFVQYLPVVWVYDSSGVVRAAGVVVPFPPNERALDAQLNQAVAQGNFTRFQQLMGPTSGGGWGALGYEIRGLTANTPYTLVITTPNYPPYKTTVTLSTAGTTTTVDADLDANPGGSLSGVVQNTSAAAIAGAQVTVKAQGYGPTTLTTDQTGAWSLSGLAEGDYQISVVASGYGKVTAAASVAGTANTAVPAVSLPAANASIAGTVYTNNPVCPPGVVCSAFGKTVLSGVSVLAYDDTVNVANPSAVLPLYRAATDSSGTYRLDGLVTADGLGLHTYKVFVNAPGYYVTNATATAAVGANAGVDFALQPKPLDIGVFARPVGQNYEFQITNFQKFSGGNAYVSLSPFAGVLAPGTTDVSNTPGFVQRVDADGTPQLFLDYPLASLATAQTYVLHIEAQPNDPRAPVVVKEVPFGVNLPHGVCQSIDQMLIGDDSGVNSQGIPNNMAPLDISGGDTGDGSGLSLPAGGVIPTLSTAVPSMCMNEVDASASPFATSAVRTRGLTLDAFLSGVYTVSLSSISYTQKGIDLTLSYDKATTDLDDAAVFTFDQAQQKWISVPGVQTIDPVQGTISVKGIKTLSSVLSVRGQGAKGLMAVSDGRSYRPAGVTVSTDSGSFAILRPSQVNGGAFTGTIVKVYNFPNPFNLETKSVTLSAASSVCGGSAVNPIITDGTVIKYEIPSGISGTGVIRIYTTSGRLVREVDAGPISPNTCYYMQWDGKNKNGQPVANGVYYGVLSVGGHKQASGTFKLAVIK